MGDDFGSFHNVEMNYFRDEIPIQAREVVLWKIDRPRSNPRNLTVDFKHLRQR